MYVDRSQIFRAAEPVTPSMRLDAMPKAAQGIHRLGRGIVGQAVLPPTAAETLGISGTSMIETAGGWCRAADLRRGMLIHTLDGGLRPLADVAVQTVWPTGDGCGDLVHLPGGMLGACDDLWLMPDQPVLIGAPVVQGVLGLPHVMVPARSLAGIPECNIRHPDAPQQIVTLRFSQPEAVWVNSGLLVCCDGTSARPVALAPMLAGDRAAALVELLAEDSLPSDRARQAA